jgi:ABC-2 type transport system permease protein
VACHGGRRDDLLEVTLAETWGPAAGPLLVIAAWTVVAIALARRSMRWEPRT